MNDLNSSCSFPSLEKRLSYVNDLNKKYKLKKFKGLVSCKYYHDDKTGKFRQSIEVEHSNLAKILDKADVHILLSFYHQLFETVIHFELNDGTLVTDQTITKTKDNHLAWLDKNQHNLSKIYYYSMGVCIVFDCHSRLLLEYILKDGTFAHCDFIDMLEQYDKLCYDFSNYRFYEEGLYSFERLYCKSNMINEETHYQHRYQHRYQSLSFSIAQLYNDKQLIRNCVDHIITGYIPDNHMASHSYIVTCSSYDTGSSIFKESLYNLAFAFLNGRFEYLNALMQFVEPNYYLRICQRKVVLFYNFIKRDLRLFYPDFTKCLSVFTSKYLPIDRNLTHVFNLLSANNKIDTLVKLYQENKELYWFVAYLPLSDIHPNSLDYENLQHLLGIKEYQLLQKHGGLNKTPLFQHVWIYLSNAYGHNKRNYLNEKYDGNQILTIFPFDVFYTNFVNIKQEHIDSLQKVKPPIFLCKVFYLLELIFSLPLNKLDIFLNSYISVLRSLNYLLIVAGNHNAVMQLVRFYENIFEQVVEQLSDVSLVGRKRYDWREQVADICMGHTKTVEDFISVLTDIINIDATSSHYSLYEYIADKK